jgi:hypothetical protein
MNEIGYYDISKNNGGSNNVRSAEEELPGHSKKMKI